MTKTKSQVIASFQSEFWMPLNSVRGDTIAKNEMFWNFVDGLVKAGIVTENQFNNWANPYK